MTQCWQRLFMHALDACDSRALDAILPWFAKYSACCPTSGYAQAVPQVLLCAKRKRTTAHCPDESSFRALLQRAQQVCGGASGDASGAEHTGGSLANDETVQHTCLALSEVLAEWSADSEQAQCSADGGLSLIHI